MRREAELKGRLHSLETLGEAVRAMKSISAHHFREARGAVLPARTYREGVERMLGWTGASLPAGGGPAALLVIGGELGLCGAYNALVASQAAERREALGPGPTVCVGHRTARLLARRRVEMRSIHGTPTGVKGIPELLLRLAEEVLTMYVGENLSALEVVSTRFGGVGVVAPGTVRLLPVEARRSGPAPAAPYVSWDRLTSAAAREFLYITVYDLLLDALASEHGARLIATQSAETWLKDRASAVRRNLATLRRESSTQEMIEIAAGVRAREAAIRHRAP